MSYEYVMVLWFLVLIALLIVLAAGLIVILATDHSRFRRLNAYVIIALMVGLTWYVIWNLLRGLQ